MRAFLPAFVRHLADRRSPRTVQIYEGILSSFADFLARPSETSEPPSRTEIEAFLARPSAGGGRRAPATRNQELAALRVFAKFAKRDLGWITNPTEDLPFVREAPRDPPVLSAEELRHLFTVAARTARPREVSRTLAILGLLSQTGLRVHELVALDVAQVDLASGTLVGVRGKGGTTHDLPLNGPAVALLGVWLTDRARAIFAGEQALLVSSRGRRVSVRAVERLLVRLRAPMGTAKRITPHTLRHSAATLALTMGTDLATVAELLRHEDLNTTRRYLHLVDTRRREAVRRLAVTVPEGVLPAVGAGTHPIQTPANTILPGRLEGRPLLGVPSLDAQHGLRDAA